VHFSAAIAKLKIYLHAAPEAFKPAEDAGLTEIRAHDGLVRASHVLLILIAQESADHRSNLACELLSLIAG